MHAKQKTENVPCIPGAFPGGLTRTRYYDGMLLKQEHMEREQNYWRMKRKLTNRALGNGVVWGLRLEWDGVKRRFMLSPGYGLDCCGNDLVVECPQEIPESMLLDRHDPQSRAFLSQTKSPFRKCDEPDDDLPLQACLMLKYAECAGDPQPVFEDACTSNVTHCEYTSVRESTRLCLVPPPADPGPTPLEKFCKRMEELKLASISKELGLFDKQNLLKENRLPVYIEVRRLEKLGGSSHLAGIQPMVDADGSGTETSGKITIADEEKLLLSIRPVTGYVIQSVDMDEDSVPEISPFGVAIQLTAKQLQDSGCIINNLQIATLLTNESQEQVTLKMSISAAGTDKKFTVAAGNHLHLPTGKACNDRLAHWLIFDKDPGCTARTLAFLLLCGWFKGALNDEPGASPGGKGIAAWWVCYMAWKMLFKANIDDKHGAELADAFKLLLQEWCAAFMYPGPYCQGDHHGVYLGCVQLSRKGRILSFDPWTHRRYVLTGPLISHWGTLFGMAPVDVIVGRLAGWICCLGNATGQAVSRFSGEWSMDGLSLNEAGINIVAGGKNSLEYHEHKYGLRLSEDINHVNMSEFVARILRIFTAGSITGNFKNIMTSYRDVYELEETGIYLLVPGMEFAEIKPKYEEITNILREKTSKFRPLVRRMVIDYTVEVASSVNIADIREVIDNPAMSELAREIGKYGIVTMKDSLDAGSEETARLVEDYIDELGEIEDKRALYLAAENLTLAGEAVVDSVLKGLSESGDALVVADDLMDAAIAKTVRSNISPHLKTNALTIADLKKIGKTVAVNRTTRPGAS